MKKKKLNLGDLKVVSFVTAVSDERLKAIHGGIFSTDPEDWDCITYDYGDSCDGACGTSPSPACPNSIYDICTAAPWPCN